MTTNRVPEVVLGTLSSDSHTWNLIFLELLLAESGYHVHNLGACVPDDMLIDTCRELRPDLLVISSVNGHGAIDGQRVIRRLRAVPEMTDLPAVIGGKLGTDGQDGADARCDRLTTAGFDAVLEGPDAVARLLAFTRNLNRVAGSRR